MKHIEPNSAKSASFYEKQNNQKQQNRMYFEERHLKSGSTNQHTYPTASQENLYTFKLESQILQLQKKLDQQQFQMQHLTEEGNFYMEQCEKQKQQILKMNVDTLRTQYQEQIDQLIRDRTKIQQIIIQLNEDYEQAYHKEEKQIERLRNDNMVYSQSINEALNKKQMILTVIATKDEKIKEEEGEIRMMEDRLDELRNIERKFMIAMKEIERMKL